MQAIHGRSRASTIEYDDRSDRVSTCNQLCTRHPFPASQFLPPDSRLQTHAAPPMTGHASHAAICPDPRSSSATTKMRTPPAQANDHRTVRRVLEVAVITRDGASSQSRCDAACGADVAAIEASSEDGGGRDLVGSNVQREHLAQQVDCLLERLWRHGYFAPIIMSAAFTPGPVAHQRRGGLAACGARVQPGRHARSTRSRRP